MANLLVLLLFIGFVLYLIGYLFFRSLLWVFEPLIEYFTKNKDSASFIDEEENDEDNDMENDDDIEGENKEF